LAWISSPSSQLKLPFQVVPASSLTFSSDERDEEPEPPAICPLIALRFACKIASKSDTNAKGKRPQLVKYLEHNLLLGSLLYEAEHYPPTDRVVTNFVNAVPTKPANKKPLYGSHLVAESRLL
jgi:hypothetical protein